jgi:hypothetical protein
MRRLWTTIALGLLVGCLSSPRVGDPIDAGPPDGYTFERIRREVFAQSCALSSCHVGEPPRSAPMSLEEARAYATLVGTPATEAPALLRVAPGDPAASYLMHKLRGTAGSVGGAATRMPLGQPMLDEEVLTGIEAWISRGALDD